MTPKRIQRQRTKGWRMPEGAVYVGRPSPWGNPYVVGPNRTQEQAVNLYAAIAMEDGWRYFGIGWLQPLVGRDLVCWCPLDRPCHADVLLQLANR